MPVIAVPQGADPGVLDNTTLVSLDTVCDVGSMAGTMDGSVSAWVNVTITPAGPVTPDEFGRFMHVCVEFVQPDRWVGKRRREVPGWASQPTPGTLKLECDPGAYWIGTQARFYATGGTAGDQYNVLMTTATMQQQADARAADGSAPPFYQVDVFEPAFQFSLTSLSIATPDEPTILLTGGLQPGHHARFQLLVGAATWGGLALTPGGLWVPMNGPIATGMSTIYKTGGWV